VRRQLHFTRQHVGTFIVLTIMGSIGGAAIIAIGWANFWELFLPLIGIAFLMALLLTGITLMTSPKETDPTP
jgi:ABC-type polysaccharide/polyol phosphate export permease